MQDFMQKMIGNNDRGNAENLEKSTMYKNCIKQ